jgi:hypothetical protein
MTIENDFARDMLSSAQEAKRELRYNPTYWLRMMSDLGAVGAAKQLLRGPAVAEGFTRLWEEQRLDLSVECFVLLPDYEPLFTAGERAEARRRLREYKSDLSRIPKV